MPGGSQHSPRAEGAGSQLHCSKMGLQTLRPDLTRASSPLSLADPREPERCPDPAGKERDSGPDPTNILTGCKVGLEGPPLPAPVPTRSDGGSTSTYQRFQHHSAFWDAIIMIIMIWGSREKQKLLPSNMDSVVVTF